MKVKTYGVPGLTEWHGKLRAGSVEVAVSFKGGTSSPSGAQPAYFMTKDPIVQFVIENSKEYKSGFVITVMSSEIAGEHPRMAIPKKKKEGKGEAKGEAKADVTEMKFKLLDDAKDYLCDKYGVNRTSIMRKADVEAFAATKGIKIVWEK